MDLQTILINLMRFVNDIIIPFLLGIATLSFFWQMFRLFIMEGGNEEKHEDARQYAMWSIAAFVVISSLWGIVNLFSSSFGLYDSSPAGSDYMNTRAGSDGSGAPSDCESVRVDGGAC